ncbi:ubiquinone biosynthesis accessory factor UbiJ [Arenimonas caeni]|jgi:ubiquinone biosynthesis protein UbiJ|uniref:Ubiquinone biosynthesis accessory factor UbiJ n=1 Tax=Arenimonas caeni TaxID=2058085 RepID=A0A2P6M957_9GAMM|nr:SCP2 sterol-binding domain-containing protein [Arenimonas caeni]MDY0021918.1 SCP2 sterol-binding domain-containing protein [Arenimonas caeni]PRH82520.1 SCP2 domain-containing protein [Arenimonas caeni]
MTETSASPFDALKPLAGRALEQALNRLVALDPDTAAALRSLDGHRIGLALEAPPVALELRVDEGRLRVGPPREEPDLGVRATISGVLSQLPFLRPPGAPPVGKVRINGDAELARQLQKLARRFDPDWEKPFADLLGPVLGPQAARVLREALVGGMKFAQGFSRDAVDYLVEERRDIVGKAELSAFHDDVDELRDRVERLAARLARLAPGGAA